MIENIKKLAPIIKIKNFPSREKVINDFEKFLSERKSKEKYKIINKTNQLLFYVKNPILAYKFNERYNNKIKANSSYSNSNCSLIFNNDTKKNNISLNISHNYSYIKPKLYLQPKSRIIHKPLNKSVSVISEYERKHWAKIRDKACIIENDSPYMDSISKEFIEKKNNEKKWVVKKISMFLLVKRVRYIIIILMKLKIMYKEHHLYHLYFIILDRRKKINGFLKLIFNFIEY